MLLRNIRGYTSETVPRFSQKIHYSGISRILRASFHPHRNHTIHIDNGTPSSADVPQNILNSEKASIYSLNIFLVLKILFSGVLRSGNYYQTLLYFTLQTLQLYSIPVGPAFLLLFQTCFLQTQQPAFENIMDAFLITRDFVGDVL